MQQLDWHFRLVDQVSSPAGKMKVYLVQLKGVLGRVCTKIPSLSKALGTLVRSFTRVNQAQNAGQVSMFKAGAAFGAAAGAAKSAIDLMQRGISSAMGMAQQTARFALEAASFRRHTLAGFELIEGSAQEAQRVFTSMEHLAHHTPFDTKEVMDLFRGLRMQGFAVREVQ